MRDYGKRGKFLYFDSIPKLLHDDRIAAERRMRLNYRALQGSTPGTWTGLSGSYLQGCTGVRAERSRHPFSKGKRLQTTLQENCFTAPLLRRFCCVRKYHSRNKSYLYVSVQLHPTNLKLPERFRPAPRNRDQLWPAITSVQTNYLLNPNGPFRSRSIRVIRAIIRV